MGFLFHAYICFQYSRCYGTGATLLSGRPPGVAKTGLPKHRVDFHFLRRVGKVPGQCFSPLFPGVRARSCPGDRAQVPKEQPPSWTLFPGVRDHFCPGDRAHVLQEQPPSWTLFPGVRAPFSPGDCAQVPQEQPPSWTLFPHIRAHSCPGDRAQVPQEQPPSWTLFPGVRDHFCPGDRAQVLQEQPPSWTLFPGVRAPFCPGDRAQVPKEQPPALHLCGGDRDLLDHVLTTVLFRVSGQWPHLKPASPSDAVARQPGNTLCTNLHLFLLEGHLAGSPPRKACYACHRIWAWQNSCRLGEAANPGPPQGLQTSLHSFFRPSNQASQTNNTAVAATATEGTRSPEASSPPHDSQQTGVESSETASATFKLAVVNPTTVLNKKAMLLKLDADILCLSETAAVQKVQHIVTSEMRASRYGVVWSPPVAPHCHQEHDGPTLRGCALGAAVMSRFPVRPPFHCLATELTESQRVAVAHVRIGPLHVRCIAVYGWPANHSDAAARNDALLCQVLKVVSDGGAPTIIGGDFNTSPQNLACWQQFQAMGYREVFQMWRERFQVHLPATCKGATRHDTVLLPPVLADLAISARVEDTCFDFDAHAPLMVTFKLPAQAPCRPMWRKPRTWMDFQPSAAKVEQAYAVVADRLDHRISVCSSRDELEHAFLEWAQALESAVDSAVRQQHSEDPVTFPTAGLPRNARGRCEYRVAKKKPLPAAAPQARHGDYNPPAEPLTVKARARTRQARRLRTFVSSLQAALHHDRVQVPTVNSQLANEWRAITKASGYGTGFPHWLLQCAHFHEFPALQHNKPFVPPDVEWVRDVCEYVRFDCDHIVKQEARHRAKLAAHAVHLDITDGHSTKGYAALRSQANPPFSAIPVQETQTGRLIQAIDGTVGLYATSAPAAFRTDLPLDVAGVIATVLGVQESDQHGPLLRVSMPQAPLPSTAEFRQQTEASCASELNRAFTLFWHPIWTRDRGESLSDVEHWTQFCSNLPPAPANTLPDLDFEDMQLWRASLKQLRVRSATGYCGFSNAELRWLPDSPFRHLLHLYRLCMRWGFPSHMGRATVSVLAKVEVPQGMHHGRPITVFCNLYRYWASTCAKMVLRQWAQWLPNSVAGSVPGRSARDVSLCIENHVEQALLSKKPLAGFSLDIIKCFNQVPRQPMRHLLLHLGLPVALVDTWMSFLQDMTRHTVFSGALGQPIGSTTGLPEGCPLSVVGMVALCWYLSAIPRPDDVFLYTYVDNLSWVAQLADSIRDALETAVSFCKCLLLPIDWAKSFAWATTKRLRVWLQTDAQATLPAGTQLKVLQSAKDLGVHYRFRATTGNPQAEQRINEACRRLQQLQSLRRPLFNKAKLIQTSVWPAAFYGCEGRLLPVSTVARVRSCAARALVGPHSSASPYLALAALTTSVVDPEVYLLSAALCSLSRLLPVRPDVGAVWLQSTVQCQVDHCRAIGPATSLAMALRRNGWVLYANGVGKGPGHTVFDLCTGAAAKIRAAVRAAWGHELPTRVQHRNGMLQCPVPAPDIMHKCLLRFPDKVRLFLAQSTVGALLSDAAKPPGIPFRIRPASFAGARTPRSTDSLLAQ